MELSEALRQRFDEIVARYPQAYSRIMPAVHAVQEAIGYIPQEIEPLMASYLNVPPERVREVTTFYFMYNNEAVGKHQIYICSNISCWLRGYDNLLDYLEKKLQISSGQTTADGRFTLTPVECLGMCDQAPVMQIDGVFHGNLTPERINEILDNLD